MGCWAQGDGGPSPLPPQGRGPPDAPEKGGCSQSTHVAWSGRDPRGRGPGRPCLVGKCSARFRTNASSPRMARLRQGHVRVRAFSAPPSCFLEVSASAPRTGHRGLLQEVAEGGRTATLASNTCWAIYPRDGMTRTPPNLTELGCLFCQGGRRHRHQAIVGDPEQRHQGGHTQSAASHHQETAAPGSRDNGCWFTDRTLGSEREVTSSKSQSNEARR